MKRYLAILYLIVFTLFQVNGETTPEEGFRPAEYNLISEESEDATDYAGEREKAFNKNNSEGGYTFSVKTNTLYDAALIPNIGLEFPIGSHFSVGGDWMYAWWSRHSVNRHWRIYGGDINARYYIGRHTGRALGGHHVGIYGQVLVFQIAFGGKGYITGIPGEGLWGKPWFGGGIEYGYSARIGKRLNLDFTLGLGYAGGEYREYRMIDDHYVWQSSHRRNWVGPTKAEISLVYLIGKASNNSGKEVAQ